MAEFVGSHFGRTMVVLLLGDLVCEASLMTL